MTTTAEPMAHVVVAPMVQLRQTVGGNAHLYRGDRVPERAEPAHLAQLVHDGLVAEVETGW